jgi:hypothetical protein
MSGQVVREALTVIGAQEVRAKVSSGQLPDLSNLGIGHKVVARNMTEICERTRESHAVFLDSDQQGLTTAGKQLVANGSVILMSASYLRELGYLPDDEIEAVFISTIRHEMQHGENKSLGLVPPSPIDLELDLDEVCAHCENILHHNLKEFGAGDPLWNQIEHLDLAKDYFAKAKRDLEKTLMYMDDDDRKEKIRELFDTAETQLDFAKQTIDEYLEDLYKNPKKFLEEWDDKVGKIELSLGSANLLDLRGQSRLYRLSAAMQQFLQEFEDEADSDDGGGDEHDGDEGSGDERRKLAKTLDDDEDEGETSSDDDEGTKEPTGAKPGDEEKTAAADPDGKKSGKQSAKIDLEAELRAQASLFTNNCLINAIALAAGRDLATLEELVAIRSELNNVGEMMAAAPRLVAVIQRHLRVPNPITVYTRGSGLTEEIGGVGDELEITHDGHNHFVSGIHI